MVSGRSIITTSPEHPSISRHHQTIDCQIVVTLWDCYIHADADKALS